MSLAGGGAGGPCTVMCHVWGKGGWRSLNSGVPCPGRGSQAGAGAGASAGAGAGGYPVW